VKTSSFSIAATPAINPKIILMKKDHAYRLLIIAWISNKTVKIPKAIVIKRTVQWAMVNSIANSLFYFPKILCFYLKKKD
jgi:hypothetical protein